MTNKSITKQASLSLAKLLKLALKAVAEGGLVCKDLCISCISSWFG